MPSVVSQSNLPIQPNEGVVIRFTVQFGGDRTPHYTYILYRSVNGRWYVTGSSGDFAWPELWHRFDGASIIEAVHMGVGVQRPW